MNKKTWLIACFCVLLVDMCFVPAVACDGVGFFVEVAEVSAALVFRAPVAGVFKTILLAHGEIFPLIALTHRHPLVIPTGAASAFGGVAWI